MGLPTATVEDAEAQLAQLNADFAPARIRFVSTGVRFCNSTRFRNITNLTTELDALKNTFADQPDKQLNFYVTEVEQANPNLLGMATFTWDPDATGKLGGFFCDNNVFGKGQKTATHEIGHCLGLWHPFHGVEEVAENGCQGCRELAGRSAADGDITGGYASDTPPTSRNYECGTPVNNPQTPADETKDSCKCPRLTSSTSTSPALEETRRHRPTTSVVVSQIVQQVRALPASPSHAWARPMSPDRTSSVLLARVLRRRQRPVSRLQLVQWEHWLLSQVRISRGQPQ